MIEASRRATTRARRRRVGSSTRLFIATLAVTVLVPLSIVFAPRASAGTDPCGKPVGSGARSSATDARFILDAAVGSGTCEKSLCDVDGDGSITAADSQSALEVAIVARDALDCVRAEPPACGQPVTAGGAPSALDARFAMKSAVGLRDCAGDACDTDASGQVTASDVLRIAAGAGLDCGDQSSGDDPLARPGQGDCNHAIIVEPCTVRAGLGGPTDRLRVLCDAVSPGGFPGGLDPLVEDLRLRIRDSDGPCFDDTVTSGTCQSRHRGYVCKLPGTTGTLSSVRFRLKPKVPGQFRVVARARDAAVSCLSRLSSPWQVALDVGDDCGDVGCPVLRNKVRCPGTCGNGAVDAGEQCDDGQDSATCDSDCTAAVCGDGTLNTTAGEECDDSGVSATCSASCTLTGGSVCGDGAATGSEECDGADLSGETCSSLGLDGGTLSCDGTCGFDTGGCFFCGNGTIDPGEQCDASDLGGTDCSDLGFTGGNLGCDLSCQYDTNACAGPSPSVLCFVTFGVTPTENLGALGFDVDYSSAPGGFRGSGGGVNCGGLVGDFSSFNDCDGPGGCPPYPTDTLRAAIISLAGFATPANVAGCIFDGFAFPQTSDFVVSVNDASRPDITPANVSMDVTVLDCVFTTTTTSTSSTVTTLTTVTTVTMPPTTNYDVTLSMVEPATVGALQFEVDYSQVPGEFVGLGQAADCTVLVNLGLGFPAFNNQIPNDLLIGAITSVSGFPTTGDTDIVRCTFAATSPPTAGQFQITVVDASDPSTAPISPATVEISSIALQP